MSPPLEDIRQAIAIEKAVRMAGTVLFVWRGEVYILHPKKRSEYLRALCERHHAAIKWLLEARAA